MKYYPQKIETKWQKYWESKKLSRTKDSVSGKKNYMLLTEFPYPSGNLHIGHWYAFALPDILARYLRMTGKNVLYPIGFDAFGLPAENAAIKHETNPRDWTTRNIAHMSKQLRSMGAVFDWQRVVRTIDPDYYKWTQWMFLKFYEKGLAYRKKTLANWCPKDKTILANEQVVDGCCERCDAKVEQREIEQWMFKTTEFADALTDAIEKMDWPTTTKLAQKNWIGRSQGSTIKFYLRDIPGQPDGKHFVDVFTTRADTLFGCTYVVISPEVAKKWMDVGWKASDEVRKYVSEALSKRELERLSEAKEKTGVDTGIKAVNPVNDAEVPVFVADYVLGHYGTGSVMAVPAHDERDFAFAKRFNLPIVEVILPSPFDKPSELTKAFVDDGWLTHSDAYSGQSSEDARRNIVDDLKEGNLADFRVHYRLHDWVLSRQRYWGVPIPLVFCKNCAERVKSEKLPARMTGVIRSGGKVKSSKEDIFIRDGVAYAVVPVPEKDLPVRLPPLKDFLPADDSPRLSSGEAGGRSPLAKAKTWVKTKCPKCGDPAERETDTMDTFVDSSWYFMRYTDPKNKKTFADAKKMQAWLPVEMYVGGAEHNTMHLLYSRFFTKALHSLGLVDFDEPFTGRRNHGIILGPDGQKMSKSRGNVVDPDVEVKKYGADAVRMYLAFMGPYEQGGPWDPNGINGVARFLQRVWKLYENVGIKNQKSKLQSEVQNDNPIEPIVHAAIKKTGADIRNLSFNTGVSELMKLLNEFESHIAGGGQLSGVSCQLFLKLLAPFAPHIAEELWSQIGKKTSIHLESWPEYDEKLLAQQFIDIPVQLNGKVRDVLKVPPEILEAEIKNLALASEAVKRNLQGKTVKKIFYIPKRTVSIVAE